MWRQIPWVANGLTVQGGIELILGLALLLGASDSDTRAPTTFSGLVLLRGAPWLFLVGGGLKTFAARRNRRFRGRGLGVLALWSAVPTAVAWFCAPSGLALLVYGSIVYRHRTSREAFALGENGKSAEDISALLRPESQTPA